MEKLKMQLFGSFRLESETSFLGEETLRSNKPTRLLVYILMNRDHMLTHRQLIDLFWSDSNSPQGAMKTLMYRLRNELKVLGDEKFICTLPGGYRWNPQVEVASDYEEFERLASELRKTDDSERKKAICRELIACYRGNVSAKVSDEPWILSKVTWYQSVYMDTVKKLCDIWEKESRWEEIELLCNQAVSVDALDEDIHCLLITALHGQKKYDLALSQYEKASQLFYENMGIQCPEKLQKAFQAMMSETGESMTDIARLLEEAREPDEPEHVFFCDYQIFRQIYRVEMRRVDRLGIAEYIILFTLRRSSTFRGTAGVDRGLVEGMDLLERAVRQSLRVGDVASKYSPTQIAVLLPTCTYESGVRVAERVERSFRSSIGKRRLELKYELAEVAGPKG